MSVSFKRALAGAATIILGTTSMALAADPSYVGDKAVEKKHSMSAMFLVDETGMPYVANGGQRKTTRVTTVEIETVCEDGCTQTQVKSDKPKQTVVRHKTPARTIAKAAPATKKPAGTSVPPAVAVAPAPQPVAPAPQPTTALRQRTTTTETTYEDRGTGRIIVGAEQDRGIITRGQFMAARAAQAESNAEDLQFQEAHSTHSWVEGLVPVAGIATDFANAYSNWETARKSGRTDPADNISVTGGTVGNISAIGTGGAANAVNNTKVQNDVKNVNVNDVTAIAEAEAKAAAEAKNAGKGSQHDNDECRENCHDNGKGNSHGHDNGRGYDDRQSSTFRGTQMELFAVQIGNKIYANTRPSARVSTAAKKAPIVG